MTVLVPDAEEEHDMGKSEAFLTAGQLIASYQEVFFCERDETRYKNLLSVQSILSIMFFVICSYDKKIYDLIKIFDWMMEIKSL